MSLPSPLCVICDADVCTRSRWALVDFASACLSGGARFLQLRAKQASGQRLLDLASALVECAAPSGAVVLVNDRPDVARLSGAHGVHVGQDDLPPSSVRAIVGPQAIVGVSTHTLEQIRAAVEQPVDYIAIGPVFGTSTKDTGFSPVGLKAVTDAVKVASGRGLPVVAIGGITLETAASVLGAGADAVAIISDLLSTDDPESRVRAYLRALA